MYCSKCGEPIPQRSSYCSSCGHKTRHKSNKLLVWGMVFLSVFCIGIFSYIGYLLSNPPKQAEQPVQTKQEQVKSVAKEVKPTKTESKPKESTPTKEVSQIIAESLPKVFTITNDSSQGSGFLINNKGDILTNAHVVEGSTVATILGNDGKEYQGTVIGYSNEVDIALIRVNELAERSPFSLETTNASKLGDEVIALGSPRGLENTATLGNISGVDRTFVIEPHLYDGIYQISAPLAPGSSGGPLLNKETEKVVAINSAKMNGEDSIGFSIPLYKVKDTINQWSSSPMSEEAIQLLFYNGAGLYFYQDLYDNEAYFDGGSYSEDYDDYYEEYDDYDYYDEQYQESEDEEYDSELDESQYDDSESEYNYEDEYNDNSSYEEPGYYEEPEEEESEIIEDSTEEVYEDTEDEESNYDEGIIDEESENETDSVDSEDQSDVDTYAE